MLLLALGHQQHVFGYSGITWKAEGPKDLHWLSAPSHSHSLPHNPSTVLK